MLAEQYTISQKLSSVYFKLKAQKKYNVHHLPWGADHILTVYENFLLLGEFWNSLMRVYSFKDSLRKKTLDIILTKLMKTRISKKHKGVETSIFLKLDKQLLDSFDSPTQTAKSAGTYKWL